MGDDFEAFDVNPWQLAGDAATDSDEPSEHPYLPYFGSIVDSEVLSYANQRALNGHHAREKEVVLGVCALPGIRFAWEANFLTLALSVAMLGWALFCRNHPIVWWLPFAPIAARRLYCEIRCLQTTTILYSQRLGVYRVFGLEVGFTWWFVYNMGNSCVGVLSVAATSLCTAHWLIQMQESVYGEELRRIYFDCVQHSWLRFVPFFDLGIIIGTVLVLSELKVVWNCVMTSPGFCQEGLDRTIGDGDQKRLSTNYMNFFGERLFAGESLYFLSESSTMCTLTCQVLPLRMGRINAEPQIESDPALGYNHAFVHCMFAACDVEKRMLYRVVFVGFLRIAIPLHLQVTLFAIQSEANAELKINSPCGLFPVIIGFLSAAPLMMDIVQWLMSFHKVRRIHSETPVEEKEKIPHWFKGTEEEFMEKCDLKHIQHSFSVFRTLGVIFALVILFDAFKMYSVIFVCNGRNWGFPEGCFGDTVQTE